MKTEDLIDLLATNAGPAPRTAIIDRLTTAALFGVLVSAVAALTLLGPIPSELYRTAAPWLKFAYAGSVAVAAVWLTTRLGRPGSTLRGPALSVLAVIAAMAVAGVGTLLALPAGERLSVLLGHSAGVCVSSVLALSLPALAVVLRGLRKAAPTRLTLAGLGAGLLAGALGAFGYALACTELSPSFVALWYTLGILLTGALGAALGPRVLRW